MPALKCVSDVLENRTAGKELQCPPSVGIDAHGRESVEKLNAAIRGYNHDDATRKSILTGSDLPEDANAPKDAVNLNNLDDWKEFHEAVLK